jgi:hypothetical protein
LRLTNTCGVVRLAASAVFQPHSRIPVILRTSNTPYAFAFVVAHLLALPGLAIALYLYTVGKVAGSGGWLLSVFELLFSGVVVLPAMLLCSVLLLIAGLFSRVRPWACLVLLLVNATVLAVGWTISPSTEAAELLVWVATVLSAVAAAALAWQAFSPVTRPERNILWGQLLLAAGLGIGLGLAGGGSVPVPPPAEPDPMEGIPPERVFKGLLGGKPVHLAVHDCKVYRAIPKESSESKEPKEPGEGGWQMVLEPELYPFFTYCERQSLQADNGVVTVTLGRIAFGAGGCCATGGTYRSRDGELWKKQ